MLSSWNEQGPTGPQGEQRIPGPVFNTYTVTYGNPWLCSGIVEKKVFCYPGDLALSTSIRWWYGDSGTVTVSQPCSSVSGDTGAKTTTNVDGWGFEFARSGLDHGA